MDITEYIMSFMREDNPVLEEITAQYETRDDLIPSIGPEVGKVLGLILRSIGATRVIEFGTCIGYSTIWLAEAMRTTGGKVTAVEFNEKFFKEAKANVAKAGLSDYVDLIHGDASKVINQVDGLFDLVLQDSAKPLYPKMLKRSIEITRINGILAADDGLFIPLGYETENASATHKYNEAVFADPRLYSTILPIGDGLTLSVKLRD